MGRSIPPLAIAVLLLAAVALFARIEDQDVDGGGASLTDYLAGGSIEGFERALAPIAFDFPRDHGAHPDYRTEWWYFTGNLATPGGRRFGYQFTLFRTALAAATEPRQSEWATRQVYMAHFAVADVVGNSFHASERFSRGAAGLAGVETTPFRAWLEDWQISGGADPPPFQLQVSDGPTAIELVLESAKPTVFHGEAGLSQKGSEPGNASYYYSLTRMPTRGTVTVGFKTFEVQGSSWLDREWSSSALEEGQIGWDWFALQLSDGRDLMLYRLRRHDGSADTLSSGTLVGVDGDSSTLESGDFELEPLGHWSSPATGVRYPGRWRISLPNQALELEVEPLMPDQEIDLSFRYWEGAVRVIGTSKGGPVTGQGYVELTGYD